MSARSELKHLAEVIGSDSNLDSYDKTSIAALFMFIDVFLENQERQIAALNKLAGMTELSIRLHMSAEGTSPDNIDAAVAAFR